ncbi:MAG: hypothetical protein KDD12_05275 [Lewinella sp.]|nr:hypothetical protein [Lewinella sp.]
MKILLEIAKVANKKKVKKIEVFDEATLKHKNSKFNEFYEAVSSERFKNDREAAQQLYRCGPGDARYRQLKSRFKKRLLNTLFFLDLNQPTASTYDRTYYNCNKDWACVQILQSNNAFAAAENLAKSILTLALKYRFSDLVVNCSRLLRAQATAGGNEKDFKIYDDHLKQFLPILEAELQTEEIFQQVTLLYNQSLAGKQNLMMTLEGYCNRMMTLSENFDSPIVQYYGYFVWALFYELKREFDLVIEIANEAESYIENQPLFFQKSKMVAFQIKKMSAFLHLQKFREGQDCANQLIRKFGGPNQEWFQFMEYYLLLALHSENYIQAMAILNQVLSAPEFKKLDSDTRDKWEIFKGYVYFLANWRSLSQPLETAKGRKKGFSVDQFLKDPGNYGKSLKTLKVLHIFLQILFLFDRRQYTEISARIEQLKAMEHKNLKSDNSFRAVQFIRALHLLRKNNYLVDKQTKTNKYIKAIQSKPFFYRGHIEELEVIPFEKLWAIILDYSK